MHSCTKNIQNCCCKEIEKKENIFTRNVHYAHLKWKVQINYITNDPHIIIYVYNIKRVPFLFKGNKYIHYALLHMEY